MHCTCSWRPLRAQRGSPLSAVPFSSRAFLWPEENRRPRALSVAQPKLCDLAASQLRLYLVSLLVCLMIVFILFPSSNATTDVSTARFISTPSLIHTTCRPGYLGQLAPRGCRAALERERLKAKIILGGVVDQLCRMQQTKLSDFQQHLAGPAVAAHLSLIFRHGCCYCKSAVRASSGFDGRTT